MMIIPLLTEVIHNPVNYRLSHSYEKYDNVSSLDIHFTNGHYNINSVVDVLDKQYQCHFSLDNEGRMLEYHCDCNYCNQQSACGHIGVTLLKLKKLDITGFPFHYQNSKDLVLKQQQERIEKEKELKRIRVLTKDAHQFIDEQKQLYLSRITSLVQNQKYEIEPFMSFDSGRGIILDFKVGLEKKYVIKNINTFLNQIENHEKVKYGKNLEFVHTYDSFDDFSVKQIEFMSKSNESTREANSHYYYFNTSGLDKYIVVFNNILDLFFDTYYENDYSTFSLLYSNDKIELKLVEYDGYYKLSLNPNQQLVGGYKYIYNITKIDNSFKIERYNSDEQGILFKLISKLNEEPMNLLNEDFQTFNKYVLSQILDYVDIETPVKIEEHIYHIIHLYSDIDENNEITVKLEYINENNHYQKGFDKNFVTSYEHDLVEAYIENYAIRIDYDKHIAYMDENSERTYEFIKDGLIFLSDYCQIYVTDALKRIGESAKYSISVGVKLKSHLLELDINSEQIPKDEIAHVLDHYKRKKKFYRLKNGELLYLVSSELEELDNLMGQYHLTSKDIDKGVASLQPYRMFSLDDNASHSQFINIERNETFKQAIEKFNQAEDLNDYLPEGYKGVLRDYQKDGFSWLHTLRNYGFNGILADDMGLGKTLQVIALLESLQTNFPSLVVCPSSLIYNWEDEVHKFTQNLKVICVTGNQNVRKEIIENYREHQLLVTSYDYMKRDIELYEKIMFEYIILDEAQYIKNQKTKNAISVKKINAKHRLALTGTPIENSLAELWSLFDFLMPQYLYNYHYFSRYYETSIVKNNDVKKAEELKKFVTPFILRRNKKDVLKELPDKIESTQLIEFNEEENNLYLANLAKVNSQLGDILEMEQVDNILILSMLTRLRQLCCEPRLVYDNIDSSSSKLSACIELISTLKQNNQKTLLFSSFTTMLDLIAKELAFANIDYYILTGNTSKEERRELVQRFQSDQTTVFLISLKAGGTGLNLTAAQAVIHYDPWWNVSAQNQATDRAYRIGQKNKVQVFQLVMKDSIEEKILKLQEKKKELADIFVENNTGSISKMSKEDILELFSLDRS